MIKELSTAFALSALLATSAQAKTINITALFGERNIVAEIDCARLGDTQRPDIETLTQLDSMLHGYAGDVYMDLSARERELEKVLQDYSAERRAMIRDAFNRQYAAFDNATSDGQRMSILAQKIALHRVDVGQVLRECNAP